MVIDCNKIAGANYEQDFLMPNLPSLTILVPNYNHGHLIGDQLRAIFSQSVQPTKVIIVDDASTDNSVSVIEGLIAGRQNVEFICRKKNLGGDAAAIESLPRMTTDCVFFAAADDVVLPGLFEKSLILLARYPQAGLCSTVSIVKDPLGESAIPSSAQYPLSSSGYLSPEQAYKKLMRGDGWFMGNTTIYRRELLLAVGGLKPQLKSYADGFLSRVLALRYGACFIPEALAVWRKDDKGYASSLGRNLEASGRIIAAANALMKTEFKDIFSDELIARSNGRFLFGALRSNILGIEEHIRVIVGAVHPMSGGKALSMLVGPLAFILISTIFCILRFKDIPRIAHKRIARIFIRTGVQAKSESRPHERN